MRSIFLVAAVLLGACVGGPASLQSRAEARIVRAASLPTVDFGEGVALKLTGEGHQAVSQLRLVERPGYRTPLHVHHETDETFFVVSGELTLYVNGQTNKLGPGDYAFVPRGTPHAQGNQTTSESVILLTLVPGAFEGFFDDRAEMVLQTPPGHPDYTAGMMRVGRPYDIEILGPAPY
ncbi:MAG: cupin domain-containing protein [Hyphomonadaceae bacterium]|nr:cupin domain-containing protein [Hyphomonadaceae bacterium]